MKEVSKQQFKEMYFKYGRAKGGWSQDYWDTFFEKEEDVPTKYSVEAPESPQHNRMMIARDSSPRAYRLFFLTEEAEDGLYGP